MANFASDSSFVPGEFRYLTLSYALSLALLVKSYY